MGVKYDLSTQAGMDSLRTDVAEIKAKGKRPVVTFVADSKSERQRGYQWGWLYKQAVLCLSESGHSIKLDDGTTYPYDSDIIHELMKKNIAKPLLIEEGVLTIRTTAKGKELPYKISTEDMSKPMFSEYVKRCKAFFWEYWGFVIPEPEDAYYRAIEAEMRGAK